MTNTKKQLFASSKHYGCHLCQSHARCCHSNLLYFPQASFCVSKCKEVRKLCNYFLFSHLTEGAVEMSCHSSISHTCCHLNFCAKCCHGCNFCLPCHSAAFCVFLALVACICLFEQIDLCCINKTRKSTVTDCW